MLIHGDIIQECLRTYDIQIAGALHIGAHDCEEMSFYNCMNISENSIIWIDALQHKVDEAQKRGVPNVFHAVITDKDDQIVTFHVSNNGQSSSVLEFGTHADMYPDIHYTHAFQATTTTIDTFFNKHTLDPSKYDFWNFDIQGAEMLALQGGSHAIQYAKAIYLEVNIDELYKGCARLHEVDTFLHNHGFHRVTIEMTEMGWGDALYLRS